MSLSKNQRELLKIAKTLVGMVLDQDEELAQDEEENLNHVHHLLDWHADTKVEEEEKRSLFGFKLKPGTLFNFKRYEPLSAPNVVTGKTGSKPIWSEESPDEVVYDSLYKNDPKCRCWFCAKRK